MTTTKSRFSKIMIAITLCLMLCVSLFAGCNLVSRDMAKYYNATVASFTYKDSGETVKITKRELITAFNSYGYQYYQNSGDAKDAYTQTAKLLIYRKLTIRDAEKDAKEQNGGEILTKKEKTYLFEMTYQSATSNIEGYYNDMNNIKDAEDESSADGVVSQTLFTPSAKLVNGEIVLKQTVEDEVEKHVYFSDLTAGRDVTKQEDMDVLYTLVTTYVKDHPEYTRAFSKYLSDAKTSEEGMKLSKNSGDVFKRELKRIYDTLYENFMVTKYQQSHQKANSSTTVASLLEKYQDMLVSDYTKYEIEQASSYDNDILTSIENVHYIKPDTEGTEYFYVSHLLAKFNEEQEKEYKYYKAIIDGKNADQSTLQDSSLDEAQARVLLEKLYTTDLVFPVREKVEKEDGTYEWTETSTRSLESVITELQSAIQAAGNDEYARAEAFNELVYKYNQDDGVFNSARNYVIGIDHHTPDTEKGTSYTIRSNMVEPFTNAAIALYDNGNAEVGDIYMANKDDIKTGLVRTEYGVHIIVYMGRVKNLVENIDENLKLSIKDLERLASKEGRLKKGESKTVFDELFEQVNADNYSVFESMNLEFLESQIDYKYYPDEYKDLYEALK